jgi:DNA-binding GntR family transcriptional regulator
LNDQWRRVRIGLYSIEGYRQRESMDHIAIGKAILENDAETASALTQEHLERVKDEILYLLSRLVFPFAPNGI